MHRPWDYRAIDSFETDRRGGYPGFEKFQEEAHWNCDLRTKVIIYPTSESWLFNDRTISCLQDNYGLDTSDLALMDQVRPPSAVELGDCFDDHTEYVVLKSCEGQWEYRVVSEFVVDREGQYPEESFWNKEALLNCDRRFAFNYIPTPEMWGFGNRTVTCVQYSFGLDTADLDRMDRILSSFGSLRTGECFKDPAEYIEIVSCSSEWDEKVLNIIEVEATGRYPGESYFEQIAADRCDPQSVFYYYPSAKDWTIGSRAVTCVDDS